MQSKTNIILWFKTKQDNKQNNTNKTLSWNKKQTKQKQKAITRNWHEKQEGRKKENNDRDRENKKQDKVKKGKAKRRLKRNKGRQKRINRNALCYQENRVFLLNAKKGRQRNPQKITRKGGFRAKWGGPLGQLTWPLNPPKNKEIQRQERKQAKQKQEQHQKQSDNKTKTKQNNKKT